MSHIDDIAEQFRSAYVAGHHPDAGDFLEKVPATERDELGRRIRLVLADEPVASLDPVNAEIVMEALQNICRERNLPVIVNLHSLDIARRYCTRVVAMAKGAIVFDGPTSALTPAVLERVYAGGRCPGWRAVPRPWRSIRSDCWGSSGRRRARPPSTAPADRDRGGSAHPVRRSGRSRPTSRCTGS